ncbi:MAG: hypothetical protein J5I53_00640 [Bradyrhizobiaceae bacterium]|nr:hypothetical protein [Bradyrhizobiaceae bacterium]
MQVKVFTFSKPYFSWSWKIDPLEVELNIANWLRSNPNIKIFSIQHNAVATFWYPTQLFVTVYYE